MVNDNLLYPLILNFSDFHSFCIPLVRSCCDTRTLARNLCLHILEPGASFEVAASINDWYPAKIHL